MKRTSQLFPQIPKRNNLRLAFYRAARGKRDRSVVRQFAKNLDRNLEDMAEQLLADVVPVGQYRQFVIRDPKERVITAPCFSERVLHHAIINICEPYFERWLIKDTYACRREQFPNSILRVAFDEIPFIKFRMSNFHVLNAEHLLCDGVQETFLPQFAGTGEVITGPHQIPLHRVPVADCSAFALTTATS